MNNKLHIGTSGWFYGHWKNQFYPKTLKVKDWLSFYSQQFSSVEINTTFYHLPLESSVKGWFEKVPDHFLFSVKASRYITHQKKLHDCRDSLETFYKSIKSLKNKQGPILFQLPPSFQANTERLTEFVGLLKKGLQYVFEFRHPTWFTEDVYHILREKEIGLCITDLNGKLSPLVVTANFTYIRLHGPHRAYQGSYSNAQLQTWKKRIESWCSAGIQVYCYFDNDEKGYAAEDAKRLTVSF